MKHTGPHKYVARLKLSRRFQWISRLDDVLSCDAQNVSTSKHLRFQPKLACVLVPMGNGEKDKIFSMDIS